MGNGNHTRVCQISAVPAASFEKETFTRVELNEGGKGMVSEKEKARANESDRDWPKANPGGQEQK